ncbi:MAG TPA: hypothetical protein RMF84_10255 [Polyangiaceae bacterium LLY-WYZ-14_1]|nr:hypothetical protein [Polyangiaceae bacterium LLY-WYZ-14_1]
MTTQHRRREELRRRRRSFRPPWRVAPEAPGAPGPTATVATRGRLRAAIVALLLLIAPGGLGGVARAEPPATDAALATDQERERPDYDGRPEPDPEPGERLLAVPRALLFPVHLLAEYVLRRPLVALVTLLEAENVQERVINFFTFGPNDNGFLGPTFRFESGLAPAGGLFFRYRNAGIPGNGVQVFSLFGGTDLFELTARDQYERPVPDDDPTRRPWRLGLRGSYRRRPDGAFRGIGTESGPTVRFSFDEADVEVRFQRPFDQVIDPNVRLDPTPDDPDRYRSDQVRYRAGLSLFQGVRWVEFGSDIRDGTSIPEAVAQGAYDAPPAAFETGYLATYVGADLSWDTRRPRPLPGTGVELLAHGRLWLDLQDPSERLWVEGSLGLIGHLDLTGTRRVVSLSLAAELTDALAGEVPFTETVSLGGNGPLSGFLAGRVRGRSSTVARLEYSWPVAFLADGVIHLATGNGFDETFDGFGFDRFRLSFGLGIATVDDIGDHGFQVSVAAGTDEFGDGPNIESVRLVLGGSRDF